MPEVPRRETPFDEGELATILRIVLATKVPDAHQDQAALLLAQIGLETARGKACQNFNVGNLSAHDQLPGDFYRPPWFEIGPDSSPQMKALHEQMTRNRAPRAFRAFTSFDLGVTAYISVARVLGVLDAAGTGDALQTAEQIARAYTPDADVASTARSLDSLRREYLTRGLFSSLPKGRSGPGFSQGPD